MSQLCQIWVRRYQSVDRNPTTDCSTVDCNWVSSQCQLLVGKLEKRTTSQYFNIRNPTPISLTQTLELGRLTSFKCASSTGSSTVLNVTTHPCSGVLFVSRLSCGLEYSGCSINGQRCQLYLNLLLLSCLSSTRVTIIVRAARTYFPTSGINNTVFQQSI